MIFSSTVALSNQGFCDAYATDPLFLGKMENNQPKAKSVSPTSQGSRCFLETLFFVKEYFGNQV